MSAKQKHLDLKSRFVIEHSLDSSLSFKAIARQLQKDCATISREVKNHLIFKKSGAFGKPFNDCALRFSCDFYHVCHSCFNRSKRPCKFCGRCLSSCTSYKKETCQKLARPPYVCNGCAQKRICTLEKRLYSAISAQKEYELTRSESRSGFAISETELQHLDSVVSPLLRKGQSIHHIAQNHADSIMCCEKTLYCVTCYRYIPLARDDPVPITGQPNNEQLPTGKVAAIRNGGISVRTAVWILIAFLLLCLV